MLRLRLVLLSAILASPSLATAQTVAIAQISGVVVDDSGGALPGVEITVTQTTTALTRSKRGSRGLPPTSRPASRCKSEAVRPSTSP
jgi:hypothetical protein